MHHHDTGKTDLIKRNTGKVIWQFDTRDYDLPRLIFPSLNKNDVKIGRSPVKMHNVGLSSYYVEC